ncbi:hypothetical protein [Actinoplanes rectilineatus]|uniref:hypothetical protein n=1 Tax=Actinoplanes rectilineatus TaxID=113571 RepID=UPI0005F278A5|nr:hypothetical protein [Actinoplanes rectilineatus]
MSTSRPSRSRRRPDRGTVIKDAVSYVLGLGLIVHQAGWVDPADFNVVLVVLGAILVGVPGATQLLPWRTGQLPSPDPPEPSPESPPSSSSAPSGAER